MNEKSTSTLNEVSNIGFVDIDFNKNSQEILEVFKDSFVSDKYHYASNYTVLGKMLQSFSARLIDWDEWEIKVEMLVDYENRVYQLRHFPVEVLGNTNLLKRGQLLKAFLYIRDNVMSFVFENGEKVVSKDDFPEFKIPDDLKKSKLLNFK